MKELVIVGGIVVAGVLVYAIVRYSKTKKDQGVKIEREYVDELSVPEMKKWFSEKFQGDNVKGILLYPTKENIEKWSLDISGETENVLIQAVYDTKKDEVVEYREVSFDTLSEKLKALLDDNGGCLVIEK